MRSIVDRELTLEEPSRAPDSDEVVIEVELAGVCGTDLHLHHGEFGPSYPLTPGHELVGRVVARGSAVETPEVGDRVVADNTVACGACRNCRRGRTAFCTSVIAHGVNAPGAFAESVILKAERCFVVNDLAPEVAVLAEPVACVIRGLDVLAAAPGSEVLVLGAGPTGLMMAQLVKKFAGARRVVVAAPSAHKLELARRHGADLTVQMVRADPGVAEAALRADAPEGYEIVIDATGAIPVLQQAIGLTRTGGTMMIYGMTGEQDEWPVKPYVDLPTRADAQGILRSAADVRPRGRGAALGAVDTTGIISHRFSLDDYQGALDAISDSSVVQVGHRAAPVIMRAVTRRRA